MWDKHFDLHALLEDEILLDLPLIPMHEHCPSVGGVQIAAAPTPQANADTQQPFAGLADLFKQGKK